MEQDAFAADVLRDLLVHIDEENANGRAPILVSHAWTDGPVMYLVYEAPPSAITWGLVRDTRTSNMGPGPWLTRDEAVRYYYLLDLYEGRMSESFTHPGDPGTILWHGDHIYGDPLEALPERGSDIPAAFRHTMSIPRLSTLDRPPPKTEPRRYADPLPD